MRQDPLWWLAWGRTHAMRPGPTAAPSRHTSQLPSSDQATHRQGSLELCCDHLLPLRHGILSDATCAQPQPGAADCTLGGTGGAGLAAVSVSSCRGSGRGSARTPPRDIYQWIAARLVAGRGGAGIRRMTHAAIYTPGNLGLTLLCGRPTKGQALVAAWPKSRVEQPRQEKRS